jgi:hypothetical protein
VVLENLSVPFLSEMAKYPQHFVHLPCMLVKCDHVTASYGSRHSTVSCGKATQHREHSRRHVRSTVRTAQGAQHTQDKSTAQVYSTQDKSTAQHRENSITESLTPPCVFRAMKHAVRMTLPGTWLENERPSESVAPHSVQGQGQKRISHLTLLTYPFLPHAVNLTLL